MRIAIIAPPFIPVPPAKYGGTELFIAALATGLTALGHRVVVFANGESRLPCEVRWLYERSEWPLTDPAAGWLKNLVHTSWAMREAGSGFDVVHLNDTVATVFTPFVSASTVKTLHHPHEPTLSDVYARHPQVTYVAISEFQRRQHSMPRLHTIHHGLPVENYRFEPRKRDYLLFLGRIAPLKGTHVAIEVARHTGLPLKIAGEIQPVFREYWEREVAPHVDGRSIEYVGEADFATKVDLLAEARAMLFPIQWDEPFGLVIAEATACGTPVLALPRGSVRELVQDGVNGYICADAVEMAERTMHLDIDPVRCREHAMANFHVDVMVRHYEALFRDLADHGVAQSLTHTKPPGTGPAKDPPPTRTDRPLGDRSG
jgi:glycosyltransferase involved in cell wall biosynthesis